MTEKQKEGEKKQKKVTVRFEVFTVVVMKRQIFWDMTPCKLKVKLSLQHASETEVVIHPGSHIF
jgi:hypothetical protein